MVDPSEIFDLVSRAQAYDALDGKGIQRPAEPSVTLSPENIIVCQDAIGPNAVCAILRNGRVDFLSGKRSLGSYPTIRGSDGSRNDYDPLHKRGEGQFKFVGFTQWEWENLDHTSHRNKLSWSLPSINHFKPYRGDASWLEVTSPGDLLENIRSELRFVRPLHVVNGSFQLVALPPAHQDQKKSKQGQKAIGDFNVVPENYREFGTFIGAGAGLAVAFIAQSIGWGRWYSRQRVAASLVLLLGVFLGLSRTLGLLVGYDPWRILCNVIW